MAKVDLKWSELRPPGQPVLFYFVCIKVRLDFRRLRGPVFDLPKEMETIDAILISLA